MRGVKRAARTRPCSGRRAPAYACSAWVLASAVAALLGSRARPVLAHSVLVRSDPAANAKLPQSPKVVSIYFSEPLEPKFSKAKVVDTQWGDSTMKATAASMPPMRPT